MVKQRAFARNEFHLQSHGFEGKQQIGKNDGGVNVENLDRLQRDGGGELRFFCSYRESSVWRGFPR